MFQLTRKLRFLKKDAKAWAKEKFSNVQNQLKNMEQRFIHIQGCLSLDPNNARLSSLQDRLLDKKACLLNFNKNYSTKELERKTCL